MGEKIISTDSFKHDLLRKKAIEFLKSKNIKNIVHEKHLYYYCQKTKKWKDNYIDVIGFSDSVLYLIEMETNKINIDYATRRVKFTPYQLTSNLEKLERKGIVFTFDNIVKMIEV